LVSWVFQIELVFVINLKRNVIDRPEAADPDARLETFTIDVKVVQPVC